MESTLLSILIRISVMYISALVLIRLSGKPSISELSTMDFVVVTILGDAFDTVIFGEAPILQGLVYFVTIVFVHILVRYVFSRHALIFKLTTSTPTIMIRKGAVVKEGLERERTRLETVLAELRLKGVEQLQEVHEARLEENGLLSVLKNEPNKPAQKQDRKLLPSR